MDKKDFNIKNIDEKALSAISNDLLSNFVLDVSVPKTENVNVYIDITGNNNIDDIIKKSLLEFLSNPMYQNSTNIIISLFILTSNQDKNKIVLSIDNKESIYSALEAYKLAKNALLKTSLEVVKDPKITKMIQFKDRNGTKYTDYLANLIQKSTNNIIVSKSLNEYAILIEKFIAYLTSKTVCDVRAIVNITLSRHIYLNTKHKLVFKEGLYINCDRVNLIKSSDNKNKKVSIKVKSIDNEEYKTLDN